MGNSDMQAGLQMSTVYLGLPAYNEEASIAPLFTRIVDYAKTAEHKLKVIVYDDGCVDGTRCEVMSWADKVDIIYVDGKVNMGLGKGLSTLVTEFLKHSSEEDFLAIMDCDDTHDPQQIQRMRQVLLDKSYVDVVVASRYRSGATVTGVPAHRMFLSYGAAAVYKIVHPVPHVRDYTCGYRIYRRSGLQRAVDRFGEALVRERGFACMVELLLKLRASGATFAEVPLELAYDNKVTDSKMDVSGNTSRLLRKLVGWRIHGLN